MFPCALAWEEQPQDRLLLPNNGHTESPDSCPIHTRITRLPTGACRWPLVCHCSQKKSKGSCLWWGLGSLVEESTCLVFPATNRYCLPTASRRRCGPTAGSPANPNNATSKLRVVPSNHTTYSNFPARCGKHARPHIYIYMHTQHTSLFLYIYTHTSFYQIHIYIYNDGLV